MLVVKVGKTPTLNEAESRGSLRREKGGRVGVGDHLLYVRHHYMLLCISSFFNKQHSSDYPQFNRDSEEESDLLVLYG